MSNEVNDLETHLDTLARNLWWSWNPGGPDLFAAIDASTWETVGHNPVAFLARMTVADYERVAGDDALSARIRTLSDQFHGEMQAPADERRIPASRPVVYFCAEFGLHESLRIYSGGLGTLAGDHLKSASDLRIPLVAIGLFYRKGFFTQRIDAQGRQIVEEAPNHPEHLPLERVTDSAGQAITVRIQIGERLVAVGAWVVRVGRVPLYLLDTDVEGNDADDRDITARLYPSEPQARLRQEIVLGMGGEELLFRLGIRPSVFHLNEGHAAFACISRWRRCVREDGRSHEEARAIIRASTVFTTHTPVPAGHDRFALPLLRKHLGHLSQGVGLPWRQVVELGQAPGETLFNMSYLAVHFSETVNGVSQLHAEVSRSLLQPAWPGLAAKNVPIIGITNGIHLPSWTGPHVSRLLVDGTRRLTGADFRDAVARIDDAGLWQFRNSSRAGLVRRLREMVERDLGAGRVTADHARHALDRLHPDALCIGFARRFTAYKRGGLAFHDPARLEALLSTPGRPVCLLLAGKAHPADEGGQTILADVYRRTLEPGLAGRVMVLTNYEMDVARMLLHGVDIWLNTPTRGLEASGTSGMKAATNGALNLSIADGWWIEGANGVNGWTLGAVQPSADPTAQDALDADALYRLLEDEIIPEYYDRDAAGVPRRWLERVRTSMMTIPPVFDTARMVSEYVERAYAPFPEGATN